ncbi:Rha family transcriptional regulator [Comamonas sp.]|uniref:Rha family transcriptional regulator n=1 Tax=Comamonas sp. TaxID=34028 RepID=UPI00258ADEEF|nr:Rha family transcriptional regulator [Comamonas sp.]
MSSREIAVYVGTSHDSVLKTVRQLVERGVVFGNETPYTHQQNGQSYPEFLLDYRNTMVVVSGYSPEVRARIIDRWQELEAKPVVSELTRLDILKLAMESEQGRLEAEAKLALAAPKVEFFDKVVQRKTLMTATQVAQKLGMSAIKLNQHLDELGIYALGVKRARVFKPWVIDKGLGELKQTDLGFSQPLFTTVGEAWIVERLTSEGVA